MTGTLNALFAAVALFVGGHFILSSRALRRPLIESLSPAGFQALYGLVAIVAFLWMVLAYGNAPLQPIWEPPAALRWVPALLMPFAAILVVAGLTTPNPTLVGGERVVMDAADVPVAGIQTVTRHPFLWGTGLWALSHLAVRGDAASMVMMGGIVVLSFGGMAHIDRRRADNLGAAWGPVQLTTSIVPFRAVIERRTKLDWRGIGLWRPLAGIALYVALVKLHGSLFGVSPLP